MPTRPNLVPSRSWPRSTRTRTRTGRTHGAVLPLEMSVPAQAGLPAAQLGGPLRAGEPQLLDRTVLRYGIRPLLLAGDLSSVVLAVAVLGRTGTQAFAAGLILLVLLFQRRLHEGRLTLSLLDDAPLLVGRSLAAFSLVLAAGVVLREPALGDRDGLVVLLFQVPCLLVIRLLSYNAIRSVRRRGAVKHPTLVLGAGRVGGQLTRSLLDHPEYGLRPVGMLDDHPLLTEQERPVPLLGSLADLTKVLVEFRIRNVVVAFGGSPETALIDLIRICERFDCEILSVPRLFEMQHTTRDMETVWGVPLVRLRRAAFRRPSWKLKRAFDVVLSGSALILLTPVLALCALAVRWETGPGVLFRQTRIGMDGRPFEVLKFRTLRPVDVDESATRWNISHDDRLGRVGKLLRTSSLDELPQLWNILRGDMTLVGPRPERPHFVAEFSAAHARYPARHRVPAGLTGWAQVHGLRGDTSIADRARFDNYYIENWTLWGDVTILLRTLSATLLHRGS